MGKRGRLGPLWRQYSAEADRLLSSVPGVTWCREVKKHSQLHITYAGKTRVVFYPASPSNQTAVKNHLSDIKKVLRELGADQQESVAL